MSSFYSDASLVMIPSGYKTSKVYSAKPTDGAGDLVFTRSNDTATRVGPDGLIEKVRTNLLLQSNTFSTTWLPLSGGAVTGGQSGYDGTNNAWLLSKSAAGGFIYQTANSFNGQYTLSIYAKANASTHIRLNGNALTDGDAFFNLSTGAIQSSTNCVAEIVSVGGGWYRCSITSTDADLDFVNIYPAEASGISATSGSVFIQNAQLETGDIATDYIPTTTTAVSVGPVANLPRIDYPINSDGSVGCPSLLLEPQTTALNQFSESFDNAYWQLKTDVTIEANTTDTLDPAGYYGAEKITETATTARHRLASNGTTSSTVNHTASVFMKKGTARYGFVTYAAGTIYTIIVDLEDGTITQTSTSGTIVAQKVEDYGNGWYRISVTGLSGISGSTQYALQFGSAGSATPSYTSYIPSFAGSTSNYLYAWGANLTATSYLQSYIPTTAAAVTRLADACSKTGIASLIGQTQGTLFAEFNIEGDLNATRIVLIVSSVVADDFVVFFISGGLLYARMRATSVGALIDVTKSGLTSGVHKVAIGYAANDLTFYLDGVLVGQNTSASVAFTSPLSIINVGQNAAAINQLGDGVAQALLFKTRLSNEQLQTLTSL